LEKDSGTLADLWGSISREPGVTRLSGSPKAASADLKRPQRKYMAAAFKHGFTLKPSVAFGKPSVAFGLLAA